MANTPAFRVSEWNRNYQRDANRAKRRETLTLLGGRCVRCGFSDTRALQVDHIGGGGNRLRDEHRSQWNMNRLVKERPELFQLLCANCNCLKREENDENRRRVQP